MIYIASPYSSPHAAIREERYYRVRAYTAHLIRQGLPAFSPIAYTHTLAERYDLGNDWAFWNRFCLAFVEQATHLYVYKLPGWEQSQGMQAEIAHAATLGIPITYIEPDWSIEVCE